MTINLPTNQVKDDFLNLLVLQLQNQDPLEPVKQEQFISQLTEISTLESVEKLNVQFEDMLKVQELNQGANLAGKEVRYLKDGAVETGLVQEVAFLGGDAEAIIGGSSIPLTSILSIMG